MSAIFWINLDARADRRQFMEQQLMALGLSARRVAALAPGDLGPPPHGAASLSVRELCVTESHRAAWRIMLEVGAPYALILEDDAVLSAALSDFLNAVRPLTEAWDIVRIETGSRRVKLSPAFAHVGGVTLHQTHSDQWGTAGYIINATCAARLLEEPLVYARALDRCLFDPSGPLFAKVAWRQCAPGLCIQGDQVEQGATLWRSDVAIARRAARTGKGVQRLNATQKLVREARRLGEQVRAYLADGLDLISRGIAWRRIRFARGRLMGQ